jgi:citronellyl-CoA dehydrogenase
MWESSVSRSMRDMRLWSIGAGADEVILQINAKLEGTAPKG